MNIAHLIVSSLLLGSVNLDRIILRTRSDQLIFNYFPLATDYFLFSIKAKNDVSIVLANTYDMNSGFYEIVIGAYSNTQSIIRKDNLDVRAQHLGAILNVTGYQSFWIKADSATGILSVGKVGSPAFLSFADPDFVPSSYIGLSTGYGSEGEWNFDSSQI